VQPTIIAIDGGSGAGKSSSARALAARLNFLYVDTGAHYRAITYRFQQAQIPYTDIPAITHQLAHWSIDEEVESNAAIMTINRERIDDAFLRSAQVNSEVSYYAAIPVVRHYLLHFQRSQAEVALMHKLAGVVMEGRDIGLNIFPETPFKYFFVADPAVKAARRAKEGALDITDKRDQIDSTRGQMHKASDATTVDTTHMSLPEVIDWLYKDVSTRMATLAK
jgi:CMP/dCMP kinase